MSVDLKNSETLKNLMRAFAGESQARNRYTFAASVCRQQKLACGGGGCSASLRTRRRSTRRFFTTT